MLNKTKKYISINQNVRYVKELDSKDHKILYNLFINSRQSLSSIGKKVGLPKNVVKYRIDRLVENNIIQNFIAMVDVFKLGYSVYRLYFVLQFASPEKENEIIEYFKKSDNTWRVESSKGRYDLLVTVLVKNHNQFFSFYEETLKKFRYYFKEIFFSQLYEMYGYKQNGNKMVTEKNLIFILCGHIKSFSFYSGKKCTACYFNTFSIFQKISSQAVLITSL